MDEFNSGAPGMDEFAQTRGVDDLFEDEIVPIPTEQQNWEINEVPDDVQNPGGLDATSGRPRGSNRGSVHDGERGRGRARGRGGRSGTAFHDQGQKSEPTEPPAGTGENVTEINDQSLEDGEKPAKEGLAAPSKSSGASSKTDNPRVQAVRGDRSSTGGIKKVRIGKQNFLKSYTAYD
jgi:hypothetical protein